MTCKLIVDVFEECEANFLVPFRVLATASNGFGPPLLAVQYNRTVRVLFAYVPLIWQIFLAMDG